ncbi:MAG: DUF6455 family protein [Paracoccaceae bacterium]
MTVTRKYARHGALVDKMANTVGVDLDEAEQRGNLSGDQLRASVHKCLGCTNVTACEHWLDHHTNGANSPPDYCRNTGFFKGLQK